MISGGSHFTAKILCITVFVGIIQMILPKGKLKQHVLFLGMMIVTLQVLEPILSLLHHDYDFSKVYQEQKEAYEIESQKQEWEWYYHQMLIETFENNLEEDIVSRLQKAGYRVNSIQCVIDEVTMEPTELRMEIETEDGFIQPVKIEVMNHGEEDLTQRERYRIKQLLSSEYGIPVENIWMNGG